VYLAECGDTRLGDANPLTAEVLSGVPSIVVASSPTGWWSCRLRRFSALAEAWRWPCSWCRPWPGARRIWSGWCRERLREASLALGVPQWRTSRRVILRTALGGIMTAILLSVARAAGETAPLLFTSLNNQFWNWRPISPRPRSRADLQLRSDPYEEWARPRGERGAVCALLIGMLSLAGRLVSRRRFDDGRGAVEAREPGAPKIDVRPAERLVQAEPRAPNVSLTCRTIRCSPSSGPAMREEHFVRCLNRMHELVPERGQSGKVLVDGQDCTAAGWTGEPAAAAWGGVPAGQPRSPPCPSPTTWRGAAANE